MIGLVQLTTVHRIGRTGFYFAIGQVGNTHGAGCCALTTQSDVGFRVAVIMHRRAAQQTRFIFGFFDVLLHFLLNVVQLRTINRVFRSRINRTIGHIGDGLVARIDARIANRHRIGRALVKHQLVGAIMGTAACGIAHIQAACIEHAVVTRCVL